MRTKFATAQWRQIPPRSWGNVLIHTEPDYVAMATINNNKLDRVVADARRAAEQRGHGYRDRALGMYAWVCGRCTREFSRVNVSELTVHHRNHNHDDNPSDGSNWELLCIYCHDNEHSRYIDYTGVGASRAEDVVVSAKASPFANLKDLLKR